MLCVSYVIVITLDTIHEDYSLRSAVYCEMPSLLWTPYGGDGVLRFHGIENGSRELFTTAVTTAVDNGNSSVTPSPDDYEGQAYLGYITAAISILFYGSNFVPVKKYDAGDGESCLSL